MSEQEWFRAAELATRWRVHRVTVWRWVKEGKLSKPVALGQRVKAWRRSAVLAYERSARELIAGTEEYQCELDADRHNAAHGCL